MTEVSVENLHKTFEESVYQSLIEPVAKVLNNYDRASSPNVFAAAVSKAVNSVKPKRRYATTFDAKLLIFLHWLLPAGAWERLVSVVVR